MNELVPPKVYPSGRRQVLELPPARITGTAFFPGGCGLYLEGKGRRDRETVCFPVGGVMILGHNYDSMKRFCTALKNKHDRLTSPGAWFNLLALLRQADIPPGECFFTNAFMGLCAGDVNTVYLGRKDVGFRRACLKFLKKQIEIQRPRFIVTLGPHPAELLVEASADLECWRRTRGFDFSLRRNVDPRPVVEARFNLSDGSLCRAVVVPITHTTYAYQCRTRRPAEFPPGCDGETKLLIHGWKEARKLPKVECH